MPEYKIMSFNIEHMNKMFDNNRIKPSCQQRAQAIAKVITDIDPDVVGICEAANALEEHQDFVNNYLNAGYNIALGASRGGQNLVFYYRNPFRVDSIDDAINYYSPWDKDVNDDGLKEHHKWDRKPLEVVFEIGAGGPKIRFILVHTKSKGIFSVIDFHNFQKIAQANRTRLIGQAHRLRERLKDLITAINPLPIIVMGDMNDGPGLDPYERILGRSFIETVMGSIYHPDQIFHNTLLWMAEGTREQRRELYTAEFPDPIVRHPFGFKHRVWIDHILFSPDILRPNNLIKSVQNSGTICVKDQNSKSASDHFAVYCKINTD